MHIVSTSFVGKDAAEHASTVTAEEAGSGARMACLRMLYGDADPRDRSLRSKCSAKFRGFLDKSRQFALKNNATGLPSVEAFKWMQSVEKDWDWLKEPWKKHDVRVITLRRRDHRRASPGVKRRRRKTRSIASTPRV